MTNNNNGLRALIYCRVSSERQANEGSGIDSQKQRCRNRAKEKGWPVAKVFPDEGISGGLFERPAIKELIRYIDDHPADQFVVIFDDLSRFARDVKVHIQLKAEFASRGVGLECLNFSFNDSEESEYAELVLAAGNQYQKKANRRQVIQKMKARAENGHWPFCLPPGLKNIKDVTHTKLAIPDEPIASIFKTAIEGYRDRRLLTQFDVVNFIAEQYKIHGINRKISLHGVQRLLTEILYAGFIEYPHWNISRRRAAHNGFISIETFDEVQCILADRTKPKVRRDTNPEFPLRGLTLCIDCHKPMTASFNTSRNGQRYPNFFCKTLGCPLRYKVVHRDKIEADFLTLLANVSLDQPMRNLAIAVLTDVWGQYQSHYADEQNSHQRQLQEVTGAISRLTDRIGKTENDTLIHTYETELLKLGKKKEELDSVNYPFQYTGEQFGTATQKVMDVLEKPVEIWQTKNLDDQLTVFFMHFDQKLVYDRKTGFGTATLAQPVNLIRSLGSEKISSVETESSELSSRIMSSTYLQA